MSQDFVPEPEAESPVPPPKRPSLIARIGNTLRRVGLLRLFVFFLVLALAYAGPQILAQLSMPHVDAALRQWVFLGVAVATSLLSISAYAILVAIFEKRHVIDMDLRRGIPLLIAGLVLAMILFASVYAVFFGLKVASWKGFGATTFLLSMAGMAVISGICEEVLFRGGIYRIMEDMFGSAIALAFSGLFFGLVHLGNPHASLLAGIAIAVEAGILLGAAYAATRNLWFPIGIHIGWNFSEGGIFGASVSGYPAGRGLFNIPLSGPDWLTGGGFGPEASVVPLVLCTLAGIYFIRRTIKSGRWCRIGFRMMLD